MKITTLALLGAGGYYLWKKGKAAKVATAATQMLPAAPVATLSTNPAPQISPNMGIGTQSPIATAVAPATTTFGSLGGTCFSSKRGMGIF
jgi:hypothetical protein